jgi:hypothetical protein
MRGERAVTVDESQLLARTTCQALLITCSDFRFKAAERRFARTAGLGDDYDLIARPGAIRSLVLPRNIAARESMAEEIRLLWGLHKFRRIVALNHLSCRAYEDLATAENEREVHTDHLRRARPVIEQPFVDVRAELYLAVPGAQGVEILPVM